MELIIKPLTESNIADFFDFFDNRAFSDNSPYGPCYCNIFHLTPEEVSGGIDERESAEALIKKGVMHGYLAYIDGLSIGWCNANDRQNYIRVGSFYPWERRDEDRFISPGEKGKIKSLVCFEIAPEYRGKGIAKALLRRVCDDAKEQGYEYVEVYPQITEAFSVLDFTGTEKMYRNAGFEEIERNGETIVMRKKL